MRFERKYKTETLALALVEQTIKLHPAGFRKIYPDRQVNNIYFDTADYTTYQENVIGIAARKKFRVRWYGTILEEIQSPVFEIKIKQNQLGDKISNKINDFKFSELKCVTKEIQLLAKARLPLQPTLLNTYERSYFGTMDGKFRVTIDRKMRFAPILLYEHFKPYLVDNEGVVVELK
ncbi:MAG: VTC domain-containing protein, partial [Bacteroidota bacterium]